MAKVALVTGGAKRIGAEVVRSLAKEGFSIALHYRNSKQEALDLVAECKTSLNVDCVPFHSELTDVNSIYQLIDDIYSHFSTLDIIINSASQFYPKAFEELTVSDWENNIDLHMKAPFFLVQAWLKKKPITGQVINFTDCELHHNVEQELFYSLSKAGLEHLTNLLATYLGPKNIRVNSIAPGWILEASHGLGEDTNDLKMNTPLRRQGSVTNIIKAVTYLCENDYVSGQTLYVDGGRHLVKS